MRTLKTIAAVLTLSMALFAWQGASFSVNADSGTSNSSEVCLVETYYDTGFMGWFFSLLGITTYSSAMRWQEHM